jgi:hypothetical protein
MWGGMLDGVELLVRRVLKEAKKPTLGWAGVVVLDEGFCLDLGVVFAGEEASSTGGVELPLHHSANLLAAGELSAGRLLIGLPSPVRGISD